MCFWGRSLCVLTHRSGFLWVMSIMGSLTSWAGLHRLDTEAGHTRWDQSAEVHRKDNICGVFLAQCNDNGLICCRNKHVLVFICVVCCVKVKPGQSDFDMDVGFFNNYSGNTLCTSSIAWTNWLQVFVGNSPCPCVNLSCAHTPTSAYVCMSDSPAHVQNLTWYPEPCHQALQLREWSRETREPSASLLHRLLRQ